MWPFSSKPKVPMEEFCTEYYDRHIYHSMIGEVDATVGLWQALLENLAGDSLVDCSPRRREIAHFNQEMIAVHLEMFGLAWAHAHRQRDKYILPQVAFTKTYLEQKGAKEVWDAIGDYNMAVARSAEGVHMDPRAHRARLAFVSGFRFDVWKQWVSNGIERDVASVAANRLCTEDGWCDNLTGPLVAHALLSRLGWTGLPEAHSRLAVVASNLYVGAKQSIESVAVQP